MIAFIRGTAVAVGANSVVVETGGIGYLVHATATTLSQVRTSEAVELATTMIVREDAMTLYGFADTDERDTFEILLTTSGIGPKIALAVLSIHTPDSLRSAIASESIAALTQVPGIGKKGAQRMILELGSKLGPVRGSAPVQAEASASHDVIDALVGLGWNENDASRVVAEVEQESGPAPVAQMLRAALQKFGRS